jgi:hypothetical protein
MVWIKIGVKILGHLGFGLFNVVFQDSPGTTECDYRKTK